MLVIPVWELNLSFPIPMSILPDNLRTSLSKARMPYRFHAKVNLAADTPQELELHDFES